MNLNNKWTLGTALQLLYREGLIKGENPRFPSLGIPVSLLSYDSREVIPGTLFICKGAAFRPEFLSSALSKGALCYVSETPYPEIDGGAPCLAVTDIRKAMPLLADSFYGHPSGTLHIVGITGTKGKTTTAYYVKSILDAYQAPRAKKDSGLLSSIVTYDGVSLQKASLTTPEPVELQRHLANAVSSGLDYLTMEVSSQALKYGRCAHTDFSVGVFLNIGEDHISPREHSDFEDYFSSKLSLFGQCAAACVNLDSDFAPRILLSAQKSARVLTFSAQHKKADIFADQIEKQGGRLCFRVRTKRFTDTFTLGMAGLFNVQNALAAISVCEALQIPKEAIALGLASASVPGRMETYQSADGAIAAIVDYAHNGMSLEVLLRSMRQEYPNRTVTVVFGCTGGKGLDRRRGMGEAAARFADRIILTEDDPGPEAVLDICAEIEQTIRACGGTCRTIADRSEAIQTAISENDGKAVVVVAGKGCETTQKRMDGEEICPSDGEVVSQCLREWSERKDAVSYAGFPGTSAT